MSAWKVKKFHVSMDSKEIPYVSMESKEIIYVSMESKEIPYVSMDSKEITYLSMERKENPLSSYNLFIFYSKRVVPLEYFSFLNLCQTAVSPQVVQFIFKCIFIR
jgi:hypothetical protein